MWEKILQEFGASWKKISMLPYSQRSCGSLNNFDLWWAGLWALFQYQKQWVRALKLRMVCLKRLNKNTSYRLWCDSTERNTHKRIRRRRKKKYTRIRRRIMMMIARRTLITTDLWWSLRTNDDRFPIVKSWPCMFRDERAWWWTSIDEDTWSYVTSSVWLGSDKDEDDDDYDEEEDWTWTVSWTVWCPIFLCGLIISLESYHVSSYQGLINTCSIPICLTCRWDYDAKRAEATNGEANLERSDENGKCLSKNPIIQWVLPFFPLQ